MSKIGKKPIEIPQEVEVKLQGQKVAIKGPKGEGFAELPCGIEAELSKGELRLKLKGQDKALYGTWRSLLANKIQGVLAGFEKILKLEGVGYRAAKQGNVLHLEVGFSNPVEVPIPEMLEVEVPENKKIIIRGIDKQKVGQFASEIRAIRPPEPYKGKGIRYEGEIIRLKPGKKAVEAGS
jgi:large subunit ribosomal protein L6